MPLRCGLAMSHASAAGAPLPARWLSADDTDDTEPLRLCRPGEARLGFSAATRGDENPVPAWPSCAAAWLAFAMPFSSLTGEATPAAANAHGKSKGTSVS